ncbi:galactose-specific lectin nattectin isoform X1 [Lates calcarifer]|uniref:Galactose-specific lectin nattectin isoform X1 n=2 Tax=Lates calcarifer TaxID=8187 RepID=A0AAJ8DUK2_LATCA|nr:galactose-specific lectin nattectin isoform X1 [Lates calcarifer]
MCIFCVYWQHVCPQFLVLWQDGKVIILNISFTMKMLAVSLLVGAMIALTASTEAPPEAEPTVPEEEPGTELSVQEEDEPGTNSTAEENAADKVPRDAEKGEHHAVKRSTYCPCGWSLCGLRCFRYISGRANWVTAQRVCQRLGGSLASLHSVYEERWVQRLTGNQVAWIGGSDAQREGYWFWIDGTRFNYANWCRGEPNNLHRQHCLRMNWGARNCWDDGHCHVRHGFVCARRR